LRVSNCYDYGDLTTPINSSLLLLNANKKDTTTTSIPIISDACSLLEKLTEQHEKKLFDEQRQKVKH